MNLAHDVTRNSALVIHDVDCTFHVMEPWFKNFGIRASQWFLVSVSSVNIGNIGQY